MTWGAGRRSRRRAGLERRSRRAVPVHRRRRRRSRDGRKDRCRSSTPGRADPGHDAGGDDRLSHRTDRDRDRARGDLTIRPGRLDVANVGSARLRRRVHGHGRARVRSTPLMLETDLAGKGADLARLIRLCGRDLPIASTGRRDLQDRRRAGEARDLERRRNVRRGAHARSGSPDGFPPRGSGRLTFESGRVRVDGREARSPRRLAGPEARSRPGTGCRRDPARARGTTRDARATQLAAQKFYGRVRAWRATSSPSLPVDGAGSLQRRRQDRSGRDGSI